MESAVTRESKEDGDSPAPVRVLLVMKNRLLRELLVQQLRRRGNLDLRGHWEAQEITAEEIARSDCEVVVADFLEPRWATLGQSVEGDARTMIRTVAVGMDLDAERFLEAVRCGVKGYLTKDASAAEVASAVQAVARGNAVCPPEMCSVLFALVARGQRAISLERLGGRGGLTLRQQQLLRLVAKGLTNKEIAAQLYLSEFTVRNHLIRIRKRLDARSRAEAVYVAQQCGFGIVS